MIAIPSRVTIVEVGPRDGLQNERVTVSTGDKIAFIDLLSDTGIRHIEVSAFVHPLRVPQMADAADVVRGIRRVPGVAYSALVPNLNGLERARETGLTDIAIFAAASEAFSRRNINQSIDASLDTYRAVCARAGELGLRVRAYLSTAFGCPFEGRVAPAAVARVAAALADMGAYEVAVSDTIGVARPGDVPTVVDAVARAIGLERIALHFHDTRGMAIANVLAALQAGVSTFDASAGGLGGCPFAPGAAGNLATEDLVYLLDGLGIESGVRLDAVRRASHYIEGRLDHPLPSRVTHAPDWPAE